MFNLNETNRYWIYIKYPYYETVDRKRCTIINILKKNSIDETETVIFRDDDASNSGIISMPLDWIEYSETLVDVVNTCNKDVLLLINSYL